jgi:NitT/TauT family transport system permease protein
LSLGSGAILPLSESSWLSSLRQYLRSLIPAAITVVAAVFVWQFATQYFHVPTFILPEPTGILKMITTSRIPWLYHAYITLWEALFGFSVAAVTGVAIAVAISFFRVLRSVAEPLIIAAQVVPKMALIPILFLWFGFDFIPRVVAVFLVCFFPIVVSSAAGFAAVDKDLVDLVRSFSNSKLLLLRKVFFPSALPNIFAGLKIAIVLAPAASTIAEFIQSRAGLGFLILSGEATYDTTLVFVAAMILILSSFMLYGFVIIAERIAIPWSR